MKNKKTKKLVQVLLILSIFILGGLSFSYISKFPLYPKQFINKLLGVQPKYKNFVATNFKFDYPELEEGKLLEMNKAPISSVETKATLSVRSDKMMQQIYYDKVMFDEAVKAKNENKMFELNSKYGASTYKSSLSGLYEKLNGYKLLDINMYRKGDTVVFVYNMEFEDNNKEIVHVTNIEFPKSEINMYVSIQATIPKKNFNKNYSDSIQKIVDTLQIWD